MRRHELDLGRLQKGVDYGDPKSSAGFDALVGLERRLPHYRSLGIATGEGHQLQAAKVGLSTAGDVFKP